MSLMEKFYCFHSFSRWKDCVYCSCCIDYGSIGLGFQIDGLHFRARPIINFKFRFAIDVPKKILLSLN